MSKQNKSKKRKFFFSCSISGGRRDEYFYKVAVRVLKDYGDVLTAYFDDMGTINRTQRGWSHSKTFEVDIEQLTQATDVVADVSTPSHGVGYEIREAIAQGMPILALYKPRKGEGLSSMIKGNTYPKLAIREYHDENELEKVIREYCENST